MKWSLSLFKAALCKSGFNERLLFDIHGFKPSHKLTIKLVSLPRNDLMVFNLLQWKLGHVIKTNILYIFTANLDLFPLEIMSYHKQLTKH